MQVGLSALDDAAGTHVVTYFFLVRVGLFDFTQLFSFSPRPELSSPGTLLLARSTPQPQSVPGVPNPRVSQSVPEVPSPRVSLECPTPDIFLESPPKKNSSAPKSPWSAQPECPHSPWSAQPQSLLECPTPKCPGVPSPRVSPTPECPGVPNRRVSLPREGGDVRSKIIF